MTDQPKTQKKIFLIDDDAFLLDMYALKFGKAGYEVKTVDATASALKMLKDGYEPDIVLADVVMPGMDGLEMVSMIRKEKLIPKSVVIMLTNQGVSDDIARARKLSVDGYIVKATTIPSEVLDQVEKICAGRSARGETAHITQ